MNKIKDFCRGVWAWITGLFSGDQDSAAAPSPAPEPAPEPKYDFYDVDQDGTIDLGPAKGRTYDPAVGPSSAYKDLPDDS